MQDEDGDVFLSSQSVDGRGTSISGCCAYDRQVVTVFAGLALVAADEEIFEEVTEKLEGDVFECECRAVE